MSNLLSRYAEAIFWLARYIERAEDLARILDVNETFSRDSRGAQNWQSILQIYSMTDAFHERYPEASAQAVITFFTLDDRNPGSVVSTLRAARENARTLRPLISTEMWTQLNIFYNRVAAMRGDELNEPRLARFCATIKEGCQTQSGITEGTFYRDEGWYFYRLGRNLERADQTTRLLDVKYHLLLPSADRMGSPLDVSQWNAVLRSAAGYHAFRRIRPSGMTSADVAEFLLCHRRFPRSVAACIADVDTHLHELRRSYGVEGGAAALERLDRLRAMLSETAIETTIEQGLHQFLDGLQDEFGAVTNDLAKDFFIAAPVPAA